MNPLSEAIYHTLETLMILPLIFYCFFPLHREDLNIPAAQLFCKITGSIVCAETVFFFVYLFLPENTSQMCNMLLCMIFFFWLYQREVCIARARLWFVFCTACLVGSFSFLFVHVASILLYPQDTIDSYVRIDLLLIQLAFEGVELAALFFPTRKKIGWMIHHYDDEGVWKVIWVLPLGFTFFSFYFIPYDNSVMYVNRFLRLYILVLFILLSLVLLNYVFFYKLAYHMVEKHEVQKRTAALELQAEQYRHLQFQMQETRRLRHDFRHQITAICGMLQNHRYEELQRYLGAYIDDLSDTPIQYTDCAPVNAVLCHYQMVCREEQFHAQIHFHLGSIPSHIEIDLCVLLGNLLENALDACRRLPKEERSLSLEAKQNAAHILTLSVRNPYTDSLKQQGDDFLSTKHSGRGQGLQSIRKIAKKYDGLAEFSADQGIFEAKILLYLS